MPGNATFTPAPVPLGRPLPATAVFRVRADDSYELLTNVRWLHIGYDEGAGPGRATFRYVFDSTGTMTDPSFPNRFHEVMAVASSGPGIVRTDDRVVVAAAGTSAGSPTRFLFDGFAQVPEATVQGDEEGAVFQALGRAVRCWDSPVGGAVYRDASAPLTTTNALGTSLPTRFNPDGKGNATGPDGTTDAEWAGPDSTICPVFLDQRASFDSTIYPTLPLRKWSLGMAVRYLLARYNPQEGDTWFPDGGTQYVTNPDMDAVDAFLKARLPKTDGTYDPTDPGSYTDTDILVADHDVTGLPWPEAIQKIIGPHGFAFCFDIRAGDDGLPETFLGFYKCRDTSGAFVKDLLLDAAGSDLDPTRNNLGSGRFARDTSATVNSYDVRSHVEQYEASFLLAPGFPLDPADATDPTSLSAFLAAQTDPTAVKNDKYRLFIYDETGFGHWDYPTSTYVSAEPGSFAAVLGGDSNYVKRNRPARGTMLTTDAAQQPLRATLFVLLGNTQTPPDVWDGTGVALRVKGQWHLEKDQLGVRVSAENPNAWDIGDYSNVAGATQVKGGVIRLVEWLNDPALRVTLMLCCVVDSDAAPSNVAGRRPATPTKFTVLRRVDGADRYYGRIVHGSSFFNTTPDRRNVVVRDDSAAALAEAKARREANQYAEFAGPQTIPRLTTAYAIGDRIRSIKGRGLSLATGAGSESGEGPVYPRIVGIELSASAEGYETTLKLSDDRGAGTDLK